MLAYRKGRVRRTICYHTVLQDHTIPYVNILETIVLLDNPLGIVLHPDEQQAFLMGPHSHE